MPLTPARAALRTIRSFTRGLLLLSGVHHPRLFVLDPRTGRPALPMPPGWDPRRPPDPDDAGPVLYLPDDSDPDAQLVVSPEPIDPATHAAADRWAAYHGATRERSWALLSVESVRTRDDVLDGDAVVGPNPLTPAEPGILRALNADRPRLARLCARAGVHPASPLAVGVDPDGLDVRASLGVVRVEFDGECPDGPAVERALTDLAPPP